MEIQEKVIVEEYDNVYVKILTEKSIFRELSDLFTFKVSNYKYMQKFKDGYWNGDIKLLNSKTGLIYAGLVHEIQKFCKYKNYSVEFQEKTEGFFTQNPFSVQEAEEFISTLGIPTEMHGQKFEIRDYQLKAFINGVRNKRRLFLSPTSSGKSLMIYLLCRYFSERKILIVVPTTTLVHQLADDFAEYGYTEQCHKIHEGQEKNSDCRITISTWQSIYKEDKNWFKQFNMVIGDEAHLFQASSLKKIMENLVNCDLRFGLTGTLDDSLTNEMTLRGMFGKVDIVTTTMKLMENKQISQFKIKAIVLSYSDEDRKMVTKNELSRRNRMDRLKSKKKRIY